MTSPSVNPDKVTARVEANIALAVRLARRYSNGAGTDEDLRQVAMMGLLLASQRYKEETGPFRPFAVATISGELKKYLRSNGWAVRVPRKLQEQTITVDRATETLTQQLGRSPTPHEIATEVGFSADEVLAALRATNARFGRGLGAESNLPPGRGPAVDLTDRLALAEAATHLNNEQGMLLEMRYIKELTQRQIGDRLGISQTQVHRRLLKLHDHLRTYFDDERYAR